MARQATRKVKSDSVQGSGSYVIVRKITWEQQKELDEQRLGMQQDASEMTREQREALYANMEDLLANQIAEWNWTDEKDKPLPLPSEDPSVWDDMTDDEMSFLMGALSSGDRQERRKN